MFGLSLHLNRTPNLLPNLNLHPTLNLSPGHSRASAVPLAPVIARELDRALNRDLDLDLAHELVLTRAFDLTRALDRAFDLPLARAFTPEDEFQLDLALTKLLTYTEIFAQATPKDVERWGKFRVQLLALFQNISTPCHALNLHAFQQTLSALPFPAADAAQSTWGAFAQQLRNVMQEYRDLGHEWPLSHDSVEQLNRYLAANLLLVECLKLAVVSDKQKIEERLLLPPS